MTTYSIVPLRNAPEAYAGELDDWYDTEYVSAVIRTNNDGTVTRIGTDGGSPEDQTLWRDWAWVAPALQDAYEQGLAEGTGL